MMPYNNDLEFKDVYFVMDRGFCSTINVKHMSMDGLSDIMAVEIWHKTTHGAIDSVRDGLPSFANKIETNIYAKLGCFFIFGIKLSLSTIRSLQDIWI
jgi:hypothetical protein